MTTHKVIRVVDTVPYCVDWGTIGYLDNFTHIVRFLDLAAESLWSRTYNTGTVLTEDSLESSLEGSLYICLLGVWDVMLASDKIALRKAIKDTADDYRYMIFNRNMECGSAYTDIDESCSVIFELDKKLGGHPVELCGGMIAQELIGILQAAVIQSIMTGVSGMFDKFLNIFGDRVVCSVLSLHRPRYGMSKIELNFMLEEIL